MNSKKLFFSLGKSFPMSNLLAMRMFAHTANWLYSDKSMMMNVEFASAFNGLKPGETSSFIILDVREPDQVSQRYLMSRNRSGVTVPKIAISSGM
mmetsp:Transcript_49859/g.57215  ORF Transcript_49859/g.57215 Transcript_49859/m.57215 type:complete len:95 (-) Transcript_49859:52-336(-)